MIEVRDLTRVYRATTAVEDLSFRVQPGTVTGFLGPNGAGKSTTMRMMVGLERPTRGWAHIDGRPIAELASPLREVGVLLDADACPAGMTARGHLRWLARAAGVGTGRIGTGRIGTVLERVGLGGAGDRRIGTMSLGMRQRVGLAAALLADPATLILDEPVNGLDPDGVRWLRGLLRDLAAEGRTVLLSSHLMSEMEQTADRVVVIGRGRLVAELDLADMRRAAVPVRLRTVDPDRVLAELRDRVASVATRAVDGDALEVVGATPDEIGVAAHAVGSAVLELAPRARSLEEIYLQLTDDAVDYRAGTEVSR
ncbi:MULTISPECIES: ABC transporter ATP-binding protein [Pseudonocardia]|uniref:ABC transporter ATP-binding protein n=2 Tax=Pseudonocardia TaxID=1847 RepID=A0ABQ0RUS2_9PSEU|nr:MULTISPECIES: ATP-binding cassette domain-containing protein [Pseudonocardia]OSY41560.1 putative ABC transporter ATP-binding protein YxlF [Pseudonocardia autotrophica]TDN71515.1 ABC-2 type transport system ATP-binding protein [Pseudonocardia autotrophica]BBG02194.1 ABC transporter ATP-binding protein [Pseudonocardia autotrophica]GEC24208.1 ABC transporter ATP-binding protein [Pseudonocardia saturnea]